MKTTVIALFSFFLFYSAFAQNSIPAFEEYRTLEQNDEIKKDVGEAVLFNPSQELFERSKEKDQLILEVLFPEGQEERLMLSKRNFTSYDFSVQLKSHEGKRAVLDRTKGTHFKGVVESHSGSIVFLSIFEEEISAIISIPGKGNYNLGKLKENTKDGFSSILYAEREVHHAPLVNCHVGPDAIGKEESNVLPFSKDRKSRASCKVVQLYAEFDYYTLDNRFNGNLNATINYAEFLLNMVTGLYEEEEIRVKVSEMVIWETDDRYPFETAGDALLDFSDQVQDDFNGDIAALISTRRQGNGGLAWLNVLCRNYNPNFGYGPTSYSNAVTRVNQIPAYSWDVQVVTHEIGHNLGSPHTHDCFWNGDNTPIDDCAGTYDDRFRGNCDIASLPSDGTIMSYCHLVGGIGISFYEGFGEQPRDYMQSRIEAVPCLMEESLVETELAGPTERLCLGDTTMLSVGPGYRYEWSTGDTEAQILISSSGTYRVTVYDQNDCSETFQEDVLFFRGPRNELVYLDTTACEGDSILISTRDSLNSFAWFWQDTLSGEEYISRISEQVELVITDSLGCSTRLSLETYFRPLPQLDILVLDSAGICSGNMAEVIIEGGDSIDLIPNELSYLDSAYQVDAGQYLVHTLTEGCEVIDSFWIVENMRPRVSLEENYWICPGDSLWLSVLEVQDSNWTYIWNETDTSFQYLTAMEGSQDLRIIDDNQCDTTISTLVSMVQLPEVQFLEYEYIDGNRFYTITVNHENSVNPISYQWTAEEGVIIESRGNEIDLEWNTEEDSSWVCVVLEIEGELTCETEEICIKVPTEIMTDNFEARLELLDLAIYPNPFSSQLGIEIRTQEVGELEIKVLDVLGRTILDENTRLNSSEYTHSISTKDWSPGTYIVEVELNQKERQRLRVIKQ